MLSVITNIFKKKTKGPTLMELFTATRKTKNFFFDNYKSVQYCYSNMAAGAIDSSPPNPPFPVTGTISLPSLVLYFRYLFATEMQQSRVAIARVL
jgi:hypothetical protein